jgi:P pilus assembly chaperone PapD
MDLTGFFGTGAQVTISATTASTANQLATTMSAGQSLRVVNEAATAALVSISSTTSPDATSDTKRMSVLPGAERVFGWPANGNTVAVALRSGTGTVQIQLGTGV